MAGEHKPLDMALIFNSELNGGNWPLSFTTFFSPFPLFVNTLETARFLLEKL